MFPVEVIVNDAKVWFTSGTHFSSRLAKDRKLRKRFDTTGEMDAMLISNWNSVVEEDDIVLHLGDFGKFTTIEKLNGKVMLLRGYYEDERIRDHHEEDFSQFRENLLSIGFSDVFETTKVIVTDRGNAITIPLSHDPHNCRRDIFNIYGAGLDPILPYGINVCVDHHKLMPVNIKEIIDYKKKISEIDFKHFLSKEAGL